MKAQSALPFFTGAILPHLLPPKRISSPSPSATLTSLFKNVLHYQKLRSKLRPSLSFIRKFSSSRQCSKLLVFEVNTLGRSQLQNSTAIITAVTASIHSKPDQFQVFMSVLEDSPESANLARTMRNELSESRSAMRHARVD